MADRIGLTVDLSRTQARLLLSAARRWLAMPRVHEGGVPNGPERKALVKATQVLAKEYHGG